MLLIDCGNTRLKYRHIREQVVQHGDLLLADLLDAPDAYFISLSNSELVWIACVSGEAVRESLREVFMQRGLSNIRFAATEPYQAGLKNAYTDASRLGVDRWLAMLAAWRECRSSCIVIDAGSALTIDLIDHGGQHCGGHIVPGLHMQASSLLNNTAQVRFDVSFTPQVSPGRDTQSCVSQGVVAMAIGYVRYVVQDAWQTMPQSPTLFITGGDAPLLSPLLNLSLNHRPHLVLDGLCLYAMEHNF